MTMPAILNLARSAALAAMLVLTTGTAMAELATIEGETSYRERIALRPGAVLEVELLDVSRADAPSALHNRLPRADRCSLPGTGAVTAHDPAEGDSDAGIPGLVALFGVTTAGATQAAIQALQKVLASSLSLLGSVPFP